MTSMEKSKNLFVNACGARSKGKLDMAKTIFLSLLVCVVLGCDKKSEGNAVSGGACPPEIHAEEEWGRIVTRSVGWTVEKWDYDAWKNPQYFNQWSCQDESFRNQCRGVVTSEFGRIEKDHFRYRPLIARFYAQPMSERQRKMYGELRSLRNKLLRLDYVYALEFEMLAHEEKGGKEWMKDNLYFCVNNGDDVKVVAVRLCDLCTYTSCFEARPMPMEEYRLNGVRLFLGSFYSIVDDCFRGGDDRGLAEFFADLVDGRAALYWGIGGAWHLWGESSKWAHIIPCGRYVFKKQDFEKWLDKYYGDSVLELRLLKASENEYIFSALEDRFPAGGVISH